MSPEFSIRSNTNRAVQKKITRGLKFRKKRDCTHFAYAKTKALISCTITVQLICAFAFAYAKCRFSHDMAHIVSDSISEI